MLKHTKRLEQITPNGASVSNLCHHSVSFVSYESFICYKVTYPYDLPQETQDKVGFAFDQIFCPNVHNIAPYGHGRVQDQSLILVDIVNIQLLLVDSSLVDSTRNSPVDQLAQQNAIFHSFEQGITVVLLDGQVLC